MSQLSKREERCGMTENKKLGPRASRQAVSKSQEVRRKNSAANGYGV